MFLRNIVIFTLSLCVSYRSFSGKEVYDLLDSASSKKTAGIVLNYASSECSKGLTISQMDLDSYVTLKNYFLKSTGIQHEDFLSAETVNRLITQTQGMRWGLFFPHASINEEGSKSILNQGESINFFESMLAQYNPKELYLVEALRHPSAIPSASYNFFVKNTLSFLDKQIPVLYITVNTMHKEEEDVSAELLSMFQNMNLGQEDEKKEIANVPKIHKIKKERKK